MTPLPLPTLFSQELVAFTIELDNEAEHRLHHRTTRGLATNDARDSPWLVSYALWAGILQHLAGGPLSAAELRSHAHTSRLLLGGLRRWGYVTVHPPRGERLRTPPQDAAVVTSTPRALHADAVWRQLGPEIVERWRARFGDRVVERLDVALRVLVDALPAGLPSYLPIVYPTQGGRMERPGAGERTQTPGAQRLGLSSLLSAVLFSFTLDFESTARVALPIGANTLRVLDPAGIRIRDLPRLSGISKEANAMCAGWLERHGCAETVADPGATRGKVLRLTAKGQRAQQKHRRILDETEDAWKDRYGADALADVRSPLEQLAGDGALASAPLAQALAPHPDNWRARVRLRPDTLPHHPMVLHRGGYPDGS